MPRAGQAAGEAQDERVMPTERIPSCHTGLMIGFWGLIMMLPLGAAPVDEPTTRGQIRFQCGVANTVRQTPSERLAGLDAASRSAARHLLVQFERPVSATDRVELLRAGVRLLQYVGDNAYFAVVDPQRWLEVRDNQAQPDEVTRISAHCGGMEVAPGFPPKRGATLGCRS